MLYVSVDNQIKNKYRVEYMIKYAVQIGRKAKIYESSYYNDDSDDDESAWSLALYPNIAAFPAVGEPTAIYVDECINKMYRLVIDKLMYISIRGGDSALDIYFIDGSGAFDE